MLLKRGIEISSANNMTKLVAKMGWVWEVAIAKISVLLFASC